MKINGLISYFESEVKCGHDDIVEFAAVHWPVEVVDPPVTRRHSSQLQGTEGNTTSSNRGL